MIIPYQNLKLVINNGKIIRNSKKIIDLQKYAQEVSYKSQEKIIKQLIKSEKGFHAVSYSKDSQVGQTLTTKEQSDSESYLLHKDENSYSYLQIFNESSTSIEYIKINNIELKNLLDQKGNYLAIKANKELPNIREQIIKINKDNRQC
jgi:hypothetical protein